MLEGCKDKRLKLIIEESISATLWAAQGGKRAKQPVCTPHFLEVLKETPSGGNFIFGIVFTHLSKSPESYRNIIKK